MSVDVAATPSERVGLVDAYRQMLTIRALEESVLTLRREDVFLGSTHLCVGQEAPPVAFVAALGDDDRVLATYRGHGWALACGVPPAALLAEVLQRSTGTNGGRGGSAYLSAPKFRFLGENSIVGAGLPLANGVAMAAKYQETGGVTVVSFGDGATNQGAAHEAIVFAVARELPVIFVCENNYWSEMTPIADTVPKTTLVDRARGYGLRAVNVDGCDVAEVAQVAHEVVQRVRRGEGPTFVEVVVPRLLGHYNADIEHYRDEADREAHRARDVIPATRARILHDRLLTEEQVEMLESDVRVVMSHAVEEALGAPVPDPTTARDHVIGLGPVHSPGPLPAVGQALAYGLAANRALSTELRNRPNVIMFGEDIAIPGGTFGVTRNLRKEFGDRVFDTPISEAAILGAAVGASIQDMRPVVEIMWMDFLYVAFDQLMNQAANVRYLSRGEMTAPMVVRMQQGAAPGSCAQHAQSLEGLLAHVPGIKVGLPATAHDAYAMLRAAVADDDPVVIIESRELYLTTGLVDLDAPVERVGGARLRREGNDAVIVSWGRMINEALAASDALAQQGVSAAVLDLRWLAPLDVEAIGTALRAAGGRVVVAHEANVTGGFGAEIVARIVERFFSELHAPVRRVGAPDVRIPASPILRDALIPQMAELVDAVHETLRV